MGILKHALLMTALLAGTASAALSKDCMYNNFPQFIGGSKNEELHCMIHDAVNDRIILGGMTGSSDFCPAENEHGFILALNSAGDWQWGNFFYNVSYSISHITGCSYTSKNTSIALFGKSNQKPIAMTINKDTGKVETFVSVEPIIVGTTAPTYTTFQGGYYEEAESIDGKPYFYMTFIKDLGQRVLKIGMDTEPYIKWDWQFSPGSTNSKGHMLRPDPVALDEFWIVGEYASIGTMFKMKRYDNRVVFKTTITLARIVAFHQVPNDENVYACGYSNPDATPANNKAGIFRMKNTGFFKWYVEVNSDGLDQCTAITHEGQTNRVTALIKSTSTGLKSFTSASSVYDTFLMVLTADARPVSLTQVSLKIQSMESTNNALIKFGEFYYFGGVSQGFETKVQPVQNFLDSTNAVQKNVYIFKYNPERKNIHRCLHDADVNSNWQQYVMDKSSSAVTWLTIKGSNAALLWTEAMRDQQFTAYRSKFTGGFPLLKSFYIPKACALSQNMTAMTYFLGQWKKSYNIRDGHTDAMKMLSQMDNEIYYIWDNGTTTAGFADIDLPNATIWVQTNMESMSQNIQRTLLRGCDRNENLMELNLYVNVSSNNAPEFTSELKSSWSLNVSDSITYSFPPYKDPEGNDDTVAYVAPMENQNFPPFLEYINSTMTIKMNPTDLRLRGQTYYFSVVLKEKHSDFQATIYYVTVKVLGEKYVKPRFYWDYTYYTFGLEQLDMYSNGTIWFNNTNVTTDMMMKDWNTVFRTYVQVYEKNRTNPKKVLPIYKEINGIQGQKVWRNKTHTFVNFTVSFKTPYLYGLMVRKSDYLIMNLRDSAFVVPNNTQYKLAERVERKKEFKSASITYIRIDLQFDFKDPVMAFFRDLAKNSYFVMIGLVLLQFFIILIFNASFLPLWTILEYMQLVAFMPLYNFKMITYLYDCFKPFLVAHGIIFDNNPLYQEMNEDYFNINYRYFWLNVGKLIQSFMHIGMLFGLLILSNIFFAVLNACLKDGSTMKDFARRKLSQYKFNAYIRFFMLAYFDITFFSAMKIMEGNNTSSMRKIALFASYVFFVISILGPLLLIIVVFRRFPLMKIKAAKKSFNTVILKIDKGKRWRLFNMVFFFGRRLLIAMLLTIPIENQYIFLQYVFILITSHTYILYLVGTKPYQSGPINTFMLTNETFYSALIIFIFIFSDATPQLTIKIASAVALIVSIFALVFANIAFNIYQLCKGRAGMKKRIKEDKLKREQKEAEEAAKEEERKLQKKREEEEFMAIPDETNHMSMDISNTTIHNNTTLSELNMKSGSSKKGGKGGKGKNKGNVDDVAEVGMAGVSPGDEKLEESPDKFTSTEKLKKANKGDHVVGSSDEKKKSSSGKDSDSGNILN